MTKQTIITAAVSVIATLIVVLGIGQLLRTPQVGGAAGGLLAENYLPFVMYNGGYNTAKSIKTTGDLTVGTSGTTQTNQITTTCAMTANTSIAATTSGYAFCTGVTGITSTDYVVANFASTTGNAPRVTDSWIILSAKASSTAGAIDFDLMNLTGAAAVPSAVSQQGSTTAIHGSH